MSRKTLSRNDYTIGWISPIGCEHVAATAMLDEQHSELYPPESDNNAYTLGSMGGHNVVIAPLPRDEKGNRASARVASHMKSTFSAIKIFLVVGIAGSASKEVRLGDVVVGTKVTKSDAGKYLSGGRFEHNGIFTSPPVSARGQMRKLETTHDLFGTRIFSHYLADMARKFPNLTEGLTDSSDLKDILFRSDYAHVGGGNDCRFCDHRMAVERAPRVARDQFKIHYGLVASGDQVIKDAVERDKISERLNDKGPVYCLEMESAGLMGRDFVAIRGISDYADSHKNDAWQKYAAAVAAACAKEFLTMMPPHGVVDDAGKAGGSGDGSAAAPQLPQTGGDGGGAEGEGKSPAPPAIGQWKQIHLRKSGVNAVALSHDSKLLAAAVDNTILLWDTATGTLQKTLKATKAGVTGQMGDYDSVKALAISPDSKQLAWALQTSKWNIELCDLATGTCRAIRDGHRHRGTLKMSLAFSQDSKTLLSVGEDMTYVFLFDTAAAKLQKTHMPFRGGEHSIAFSHDARTLASGSRSVDGKIELWDMVTGRLQNTLEGHKGGVSCVAFSRDSRILASGSKDGNIRLWDTWSGQVRKTLVPVARQGLWALTFMQGFTLLSSTLKPNTIDVWDTETGQLQQAVPVSEDIGTVTTLLGSHDSRFFVSASLTRRSRGVRVWSQEPGVRGKD
jgi:nucleoside phosphorylase